jgi:hypothetical protein
MATARRAIVVLPGGWWLRTRGELGAALPNVAARIPARQLRITAGLYNL